MNSTLSPTRAGFELYVSRTFGITVFHNRQETKPGYSEALKVGGCAHTDTREVYFAQDCDDSTAIVAIAHEVGHILECDDTGLELYSWRKSIDLYDLEREAWERAAIVLTEWQVIPSDYPDAFRTLRIECLKSYKQYTDSAEYVAQQTKLLEAGRG
jgi:hypothetical protein